MNSGHGLAAGGSYRPLSQRQAARLVARYAEPPGGFSRAMLICFTSERTLASEDGAGRLAHPVVGVSPALKSARIFRIEAGLPGKVRVHIV